MPTKSISDLPAELLLRVTEHLAFNEVKILSIANRQFRQFLLPSVYKTIVATNRERDAADLEQIVKKYGRHVVKLVFDCHLHPKKGDGDESESEAWMDGGESDKDYQDDDDQNTSNDNAADPAPVNEPEGQRISYATGDDGDEEMTKNNETEDNEIDALRNYAEENDPQPDQEKPSRTSLEGTQNLEPKSAKSESPWTQPGFSQIAQDLLAGKYLPSLKALSIKFLPLEDFNGVKGVWSPGFDLEDGTSIYMHERLETEEERIADERDYQWRADLNLAFKCLSRNNSIERLALHNFLPKSVSMFTEPEWPLFLTRLSAFDIHLWGGDNGAGWHSSTLDGYMELIASLPELIFEHLHSAQELTFAADEYSMVGCEGVRMTPIPLVAKMFPQLRSLTIEHCYIDPALSTFVQQKSQQLDSLRIINSFSAFPDEHGAAFNGISWATLFRDLRNARPVLKTFELSNNTIELVAFHDSEEELRTESDIRAQVESSGGELKLFGYGEPSDKYGDIMQNDETNIKRFKNGEDQREYDALMEVVASNRRAAAVQAVNSRP